MDGTVARVRGGGSNPPLLHCDKEEDVKTTLRLDRVSFRYDGGEWAIRDLSLTVKEGEWLALMGPSGSGKSTVARLACRLLVPASGSVQAAPVGYVAQDPQTNIVGETVGEDVAFALQQGGMPPEEVWPTVLRALRAVDMEEAVDRRMSTLSGGELQRVAIAGALARGARLLVMDEPTSHLATPAVRSFWDGVTPALKQAKVSVLVITHRPQEAMRADTLGILARGALAAYGPASKLVRQPDLLRLLGVDFDPVEAIAGWCQRHGHEVPWPTDYERLVKAVCSLWQTSR